MRRLAYREDFANPAGHYANNAADTVEEYGTFSPDSAEITGPVSVTFTAPSSGAVHVIWSCDYHTLTAATEYGYVMLRESGATIAGSRKRISSAGPNNKRRIHYSHRITGLTPSSSHTYTIGWEGGPGTDDIRSSAADLTRFQLEVWEIAVAAAVPASAPVFRRRHHEALRDFDPWSLTGWAA